jgi:predicted HicB family RNase H-like nuclease
MSSKTVRPPQADSHAATAVLQVAERLYGMDPEWVVFFREVLGVDGIVRRTFSEPDALMRFECSPQYARIREMLDGLRARQQDRQAPREAQRVVTVRMPRSLHETLKSEAEQLRVSVNTLCISKLMKLLAEQEARDLGGDTEPESEVTAMATVGGRGAKRTGADL